MIKSKKKYLKQNLTEVNDQSQAATSFREQMIYSLQKELLKECAKCSKCFSCKTIRPTVRKEGNVSFYVTRTVQEDISKGIMDKNEKNKKSTKKTQMIYPNSIKEHLQSFYHYNKKLLDLAFGRIIPPSSFSDDQKFKTFPFNLEDFFMDVLSVTPNRFRPDNKLGDQIFLHSHTTMYIKIMSINEEIKKLISEKNKISNSENSENSEKSKSAHFFI